jgi:hypothetical protein
MGMTIRLDTQPHPLPGEHDAGIAERRLHLLAKAAVLFRWDFDGRWIVTPFATMRALRTIVARGWCDPIGEVPLKNTEQSLTLFTSCLDHVGFSIQSVVTQAAPASASGGSATTVAR